MNLFGTYSLLDAAGGSVDCWISWMARDRDWSFIDSWKDRSRNLQIRDSIDYAETGAKRWQWLRRQKLCIMDAADGLERIQRNPKVEFGFALALSVKQDRKNRVIGFCYLRRLWLNRLCFEFLGTDPLLGMKNTGSLLLWAAASLSRTFRSVELWGECTAESRAFYQKVKARLLVSALQEAVAQTKAPSYPRDWQLPGDIEDRFVFGRHELVLMSEALRSREAR